MQLQNLHYVPKSRNHKAKIKGRGYGSGMGKRSTRGDKGQKARKSGNVRIAFEGGQTPIYRRLPKVGFNHQAFKKVYVVIPLHQIKKLNESVINREVLKKHQLIGKRSDTPIKIIGNCALTSPLNITVDFISAGAKKSILAAGGSCNVVTESKDGKSKEV